MKANPSQRLLVRLSTLVLAFVCLAAAAPARALPVIFDGPDGFGIGASNAQDAFDAGFLRLTPEEIAKPASYGITIPEPVVLSAALNSAPSLGDPITATSIWTVQNPGAALADVWLVFLKPLTYDPTLVGIDLQSGQWGVVQIAAGGSEYFYPTVRLGNLAAGGSVQFTMHHVVGTALTQSGTTLYLPQYGVGLLAGAVPEPRALLLVPALLLGLALRRGARP